MSSSTLYATLEDFKAARNVEDNDRDDAFTSVLLAASRQLDRACSKSPGGFALAADVTSRTYSTVGRTYADRDGIWLLVDDIGSETGLMVEVGSGSSWSTVTDYETGPENALARGLPITRLGTPGNWTAGRRVRVTARFGFPAVPEEIKRATLIQANRLYMRKDSAEGIKGSADWGAVRLSKIDPDVEALIWPFMAPGFG
ncbi:phage gp6-like head-tail connector protein [Micromonospora sp. WMMD1274]|uniref:phage gp6-like head-tail connector protein n=1 Tax=Micromonospora sp. WMMD1274 TaxID=3404116 RepID=UPI003B950AB7